jgi:hypothetical protein
MPAVKSRYPRLPLLSFIAALAAGCCAATDGDPAVSFMGTGSNSQEQLINRRAARLAIVKKPDAPPRVDAPAANDIDRLITALWREKHLSTATNDPPLCNDFVFLRRAYLDVVGAAPTLAETKRLLDDPHPGKRVRLIDDLLARGSDYAAHWTPFWLDALASNTASTFGGVISARRHGLRQDCGPPPDASNRKSRHSSRHPRHDSQSIRYPRGPQLSHRRPAFYVTQDGHGKPISAVLA